MDSEGDADEEVDMDEEDEQQRKATLIEGIWAIPAQLSKS